FAPQLHESAGGLPKTKLVSHSCSLAGSTSAMKVSNWGGHLHFREVGELEKMSAEEARILEKEVWDAICGCGGDKSPGTDGFNFKFIRKF
ncbi:hypothetical protein Tco_0170900, partial [Tanacetum coccineum]